ncbi:uncharacterized protein LOC135374008 isoform X5 [Ornithodoros turicata]|uniref:uncharacterized protein LOC135374008 isoform X5 n=1 Tax=Ornithodoros turicata TaxID=34597 RepID=UPI003139F897
MLFSLLGLVSRWLRIKIPTSPAMKSSWSQVQTLQALLNSCFNRLQKYTVPAACFWIFSEIVQVVMQLYLAAAMMMQQRFDMPEWDPELRTVREHIANIVLVTVTKVLYTMFFIWKFTTYLDKMAPSPASGAPTQPPDAGTGAAPVQPANAGVAPQNVGMWPAGAQYNQPYPLYGGAAQQCPAPVGGMGPLAAVQPGGVLQKM